MNKKILVVAALLMVVCVGGAFAWGIGIQGGGGYPLGGGAALTIKLDSPWVFALDGYFGNHRTIFSLTGDYWFLNDTIVGTPVGPLNWFLGGGFGVGAIFDNNLPIGLALQLAARLPIGLNMMIAAGPLALEPYLQVVPALGVNLFDKNLFHFGFAANLGLRLHF